MNYVFINRDFSLISSVNVFLYSRSNLSALFNVWDDLPESELAGSW